jgi:hypothetical protein
VQFPSVLLASRSGNAQSLEENLDVGIHQTTLALFRSSVVHTLMDLALCLFKQGEMYRTLRRVALPLNHA